MEITPQQIKETVERPDEIMNCDHCGKCFYMKKFRGKGKLLVMAEVDGANDLSVTCFGWIEGVLYIS